MARSLARHGYGTTLGFNAYAPTAGAFPSLSGLTYTAIGEIKSIKGPSVTVGTSEITHLNSDAGIKEFLAGFQDPGEVTLTVNFLEATLTLFNSEASPNAIQAYEITLPMTRAQTTATKFQFAGIATSIPFPDVLEDGPIMGELTIKVTGAISYTPGS